MDVFSAHDLNVDLHCHSTVSDGTLEPEELVQRAKENGAYALALTDHDELGGLARAQAAADRCQLNFVPGVEISVTWGGETVHIVGLQVDPQQSDLVQGLEATRGGRDARAREMADQLARAGIHGAYEGARQYADNPQLVSRTHFARFLVESGVCQSVKEVFSKYLIEGKPGFVPHKWATLSDAVRWIRAAGGVAIIAHPGRYKFDTTKLHALIGEFRDLGGRGIEVVSGSHTMDQYRTFAEYASEYGLMASRGSDFHGPGEGTFDLGQLPGLPDSVVPVWHNWY